MFINKIISCNNNVIYDFIDKRLDYLNNKFSKINNNYKFIGDSVEEFPFQNVIVPGVKEDNHDDKLYMWKGFIPEDVKIYYYWMIFEDKKYNLGNYFYVDTRSFIYDFILELRNKNISSNYELIKEINDYCRNYFTSISNLSVNRSEENIFDSLFGSNLRIIPLNNKKLSDLKHMNAAYCSPINAMANNLLTFLGYKSLYLIGNVMYYRESSSERVNKFNYYDHHAFIIGEFDGYWSVLDFSAYGYLLNIHDNRFDVKYMPYIEKLIPINENIFKYLRDNDNFISCDNSVFFEFDDSIYSFDIEGRYYEVGDNYIGEELMNILNKDSYYCLREKDVKKLCRK